MSECSGFGKCHGCLNWCIECGNVSMMCDDSECEVHRRRLKIEASMNEISISLKNNIF